MDIPHIDVALNVDENASISAMKKHTRLIFMVSVHSKGEVEGIAQRVGLSVTPGIHRLNRPGY